MGTPYVPTIVAPADQAVIDLTLGFDVTFDYNADLDNAALGAWSLARSNASTTDLWEYWDAVGLAWGTAGDPPVWNSVSLLTLNGDGSWTYPFPAAHWLNDTWLWQLANEDVGLANPGAESLETVNGLPLPSVALAAPSATTATPTYSWTFTPASGGTQASWQVFVYELATTVLAGFEPGVTDAIWSASGTGATASVVQDAGVLLNGEQLVAYVQVGELVGAVIAPSAWVSRSWTLAFTGPLAPTVTAVGQVNMTTGSPEILVTVTAALTGLAPTWAHIQFSDDDATWFDAKAHVALVAGVATYLDPLVKPGVQRTYRAATVGAVGGVDKASPWSTHTALANFNKWVLLDPTNPSGAVTFHLGGNPRFSVSEQSTRYYPLGRPTGVKATDNPKGKGAQIQARINSYADQTKLEKLLLTTGLLYLIGPYGAWPISLDGERAPTIEYTTAALPVPFFDTTFGYVEAIIPAAAGSRAP